jgi:hypothetical protein
MPYHEFFWTERAIRKIGDNNLTVQDVEFAVLKGRDRGFSRQSGLPLYLGRSRDGRRFIVVYEPIDATQIAVVTAFVVKRDDEDV